ncbi:MAG: hypothetical protein ACXVPU_07310 [Bacteroidia bacterium]
MKAKEKQPKSKESAVQPDNQDKNISDGNFFVNITYLSCDLALKEIRREFGESAFKQYRHILSEVCEEYGLWKSIDDKEALSRISLENGIGNPNLKNLVNDIESCYEYCDRIYFLNNKEIIPFSNKRYFLLITMCLNNFSDENIEKILSYQYSIYPDKKEFLKRLMLNVREYNEKIILTHKVIAVIVWIEEKSKMPLETEFEKLEVFTNNQIIEVIYNGMTNRFISHLDKEIFYEHFITNNPNLLPINQTGNRYDFIYLFDALAKYMNKGILNIKNTQERCDKWLSEHCTFEGKKLTAKNISTIRAKVKENAKDNYKRVQPKNLQIINEIMKEVISVANFSLITS